MKVFLSIRQSLTSFEDFIYQSLSFSDVRPTWRNKTFHSRQVLERVFYHPCILNLGTYLPTQNVYSIIWLNSNLVGTYLDRDPFILDLSLVKRQDSS